MQVVLEWVESLDNQIVTRELFTTAVGAYFNEEQIATASTSIWGFLVKVQSLMKSYSFVEPGLMHFCSPRTHICTITSPLQDPTHSDHLPLPTLSPSDFRQGSRGLVEKMFATSQIYVGCAKKYISSINDCLRRNSKGARSL